MTIRALGRFDLAGLIKVTVWRKWPDWRSSTGGAPRFETGKNFALEGQRGQVGRQRRGEHRFLQKTQRGLGRTPAGEQVEIQFREPIGGGFEHPAGRQAQRQPQAPFCQAAYIRHETDRA
jgi:hypothetical protein